MVPVYFVFMLGLFAMGNLMIVRQALVTVTRNAAWSEGAAPGGTITGPYRGTLSISVDKENKGFVFNEGDGGKITQEMIGNVGTSKGLETAREALNNEPVREEPFLARKVTGSYRYDGLNFGPALIQETEAAVLLPQTHRRKLYRVRDNGTARPDGDTSGKDHFVVDWSSKRYDPSAGGSDDSRPINPVYERFFPGPEGIWRKGARINGGVNQEHSFYESRVKAGGGPPF